MVAVLCALGAALLYALASVLQQRSAAGQPDDQSLRVGLLTRLARQPVWLAGIAADGAGFVLQFVAIGQGTIVVVQPLLVAGLLFALPIGARLEHARLRAADWVAAAAVCAGLATFLAVASPAAGRAQAPTSTWVPLLVVGMGVGAVLGLAGVRAAGRNRALLMSAGAGVVYGVTAGLTKSVAGYMGHDVVGTLDHWELYALLGVGAIGMLLAQSAFQAGSLDVSLPTMTAVDPVVSICVGALAFDEAIDARALPVAIEVVALAVMVGGIFALARSPAVRRVREAPVPSA